MKKLLTITALLFSVTLFSQESKLIIKSEGMKIFDVKSSNYQFWDGYNEIAKIKSSGQDTLEITYPALIKNKHLFKYIKVGDKIFQEIEQPKTLYSYPQVWYQYPSYYPNLTIKTFPYQVDTPKLSTADTASFRWSDISWSDTTPKRTLFCGLDSLSMPVSTKDPNYIKFKKQIDSLQRLGGSNFHPTNVNIESKYMKKGVVKKPYWQVRGNEFWVLTYELWNIRKSKGYKLLKEERIQLIAEKAAKEADKHFKLN